MHEWREPGRPVNGYRPFLSRSELRKAGWGKQYRKYFKYLILLKLSAVPKKYSSSVPKKKIYFNIVKWTWKIYLQNSKCQSSAASFLCCHFPASLWSPCPTPWISDYFWESLHTVTSACLHSWRWFYWCHFCLSWKVDIFKSKTYRKHQL